MGIVNYTYNRSTSGGGEIITHLINSTDGQGLSFANGALAQLTYAAGGVFGTADFSVEFIIDQSSANSNNKILYTSGGSNEFQITSETGSSKIELTFDSTDYDLSYDMSADYGSPVHYVLTFDRSALATLYKDGNSVATVDISGSSGVNLDSSGTAAGYLGGVSDYGVTGVFYRWRTWKKLLSAADVTACYENASVPIVDQWTNCVTDLDMAFANPERSLQIQSRSGAGDAIASAGIFQITPIEQLNSKSARIGTTAATPADGDIVADQIGVGVVPTKLLHIKSADPVIRLEDSSPDGVYGEIDGAGGSLILSADEGAGAASSNIQFKVDASEKMRITSTGYVEMTGAADVRLTVGSQGTAGNNDSNWIRGNGTALGFNAAGGATTWEVSGTEKMRLDAAGNVGLSVTPEATNSLATSLQVGGNANISSTKAQAAGGEFDICHNTYWGADGNQKYISTDEASMIRQGGGALTFRNAPTGTADATATFTTRLSISSAGLASFNNGIKINAGALQLDDVAESIDFLQSGAINFDSGGLYTGRTLTVGSNRAGGVSGGTTHLTIFEDTGVTEIAKVVETGGVLKSNLLTNSAFSVWSNSTLEIIGSELVANGTFASDTSWTKETGWIIGSGVASITSGALDKQIYQIIGGLEVGKLYEISAEVTSWGTGGSVVFFVDDIPNGVTATGVSTVTHCFEATAVTAHLSAVIRTVGTTLSFTNFSVKEAVPGCVAADSKAMDGWFKSSSGNVDIFRQHNDAGTYTKGGSFYALKATTSGTVGYVHPIDLTATAIAKFAGRTITAGFWAKTSTANHVRMRIYDNVTGVSFSGYCPDDGNWHWLEHTATINAAATSVYPITIYFDVSGVDAYISQPMLVFGSAIGAGNYSAPPGEIVWCEKAFASNKFYSNGHSDISATTMNLEADTNGRFPKGAKAFTFSCEIRDSASSTSDGYLYFRRDASSNVATWASCYGLANDKYGRANGTAPCDANGDYSYTLEASGSDTADIWMSYVAVQLR